MDVSPFLPLPAGLVIEQIDEAVTNLTVLVQATAPTACCPLCQTPSEQIHSYYQRIIADLPCGGRQVTLRLVARKFYCLNLVCSRRIFTERLPGFVQPWAHRTTRLLTALRAIGFATSGEAGACLAALIGMAVSPSTLLRHMKATPVPEPGTVTKVGIDDFALRRGRTYGTILVDLETHRVIDLLPDRSAATATAWFRAHPEIDLISRDRGTDYATAATLGAPQAIQTADRFHLVSNLVEAVEVAMAQCLADLRHSTPPEQDTGNPTRLPEEDVDLPPLETWRPRADRAVEVASRLRQTERYERYQQVQALRAERLTSKEIARRLGMAERTVRHWLHQGEGYIVPQAKRYQKRTSRFDSYAAFVLTQWEQGCRNGMQLFRDIKAQGYQGSFRTFYRFLDALHARRPLPSGLPVPPWQRRSLQEVTWLLVRNPVDLTETEQGDLHALYQASQLIEEVYHLTQDFLQLVHQRQGAQLDMWLLQARASPFPAFHRFVNGIERDKAAVQAGLTLGFSNGMVEGQVHRLKLIKRQMFGRASFPLLRQRVLYVG